MQIQIVSLTVCLVISFIISSVVLATGVTAVSASNIGEGIDNIEKSQMGDLTKGHNFIRDDLLGGSDFLYGMLETGLDIAFGVVSGMASGNLLKGFDNIRNGIKTAIEIGGNVLDGALNELIIMYPIRWTRQEEGIA